MANNIIQIDLRKWVTMKEKAATWQPEGREQIGCSIEYICKLVKQGKIKSLRIPQLNITLVER